MIETTIIPAETQTIQPWYPQPGEPHTWNQRFIHYYLSQPSVNRSVLQAYRQYRIDMADTDQERTEAQATMNVGEGWYRQANNWQWVARAQAYDRYVSTKLLGQQEEALLVHKAQKLNYWAQYLERASRELANRPVEDMGENLLVRTIKTINREFHAELPQQPQTHLHLVALHPDLQKAIRSAIEKRK